MWKASLLCGEVPITFSMSPQHRRSCATGRTVIDGEPRSHRGGGWEGGSSQVPLFLTRSTDPSSLFLTSGCTSTIISPHDSTPSRPSNSRAVPVASPGHQRRHKALLWTGPSACLGLHTHPRHFPPPPGVRTRALGPVAPPQGRLGGRPATQAGIAAWYAVGGFARGPGDVHGTCKTESTQLQE